MAKLKTKFICQNCGASFPKWTGKCENCGNWNTLVEEIVETSAKNVVAQSAGKGKKLQTQNLDDIISEKKQPRISSGIADLDAVLGGGFLPAGVVLIAGQPGIGKSTLLMQLSGAIGETRNVLYVSGEESAEQVAMRAKRLGASGAKNLKFAASVSADDIASTIGAGDFEMVIIDSIQTLAMAEISSAAGSVSQITNSSNLIIQAAKNSGTAVVLVGHITKEGSIAGPKTLEHMVDVVLNFEGDRYGGFKVVRAVKNRYGSTSEAAIFEMDEAGLKIVENPSAALLAERQNTDGSVILATLEGTRPILVEIQALVSKSNFGYPKRAASGFDLNRLNLLVAVIQQRTKLDLSDKDIFINVVGGLKLNDQAADLAVAMAIASAAAGRKLNDGVAVFGEIGLGGEIRTAQQFDRRVSEAKKLGFNEIITPQNSSKSKFIRPVKNLRDALIQYLQ
ncbi:MAG: DNA repair protein RadA [bacterium]|nr:DNA repair protein RadA [bacterium]